MMWHLLAGRQLFEPDDPKSHSAVKHLAYMIAILGPVPPVLVEREKSRRGWQWSPQVLNRKGQLCGSPVESYGSPFFDDYGKFIGNHLVPRTRTWENEVPGCIPKEEVDAFFKFMKRMICWLPEDRATAKELKNDPWLGDPI